MKGFLLTAIAILILHVAEAQYKPASQRNRSSSGSSSGLKDKIYFGGGGGFSGGSNYVNLSVSPLVGYKITDEFSAGIRFTYQFVKFYDTKYNFYGLGPFLRYNVTEKIFAYTEYEYLNFETSFGERDSYNSWFVGGGYSEPLGDKASFNITALYNVLYRDGSNSPYNSPFVFRVGIAFGL